jgi:hypothetical protein
MLTLPPHPVAISHPAVLDLDTVAASPQISAPMV